MSEFLETGLCSVNGCDPITDDRSDTVGAFAAPRRASYAPAVLRRIE